MTCCTTEYCISMLISLDKLTLRWLATMTCANCLFSQFLLVGYLRHNRNPWLFFNLKECNAHILKRETLVTIIKIIFGSFANITTWQRFNLEILLEECG